MRKKKVKPPYQVAGRLIKSVSEKELVAQELENSCFNSIDYPLIELDSLRFRIRKEFGVEMESKPFIDTQGSILYGIYPGFGNRWFYGRGENLSEAMYKSMERVKNNFPKKNPKVEKLIRTFRSLSSFYKN